MDDTGKQYCDSIFWVEIEKIHPNPFQPRKEFDEVKLKELSDSIRQYGLLQPLVVTRKEIEHEDGSISVRYELIAGERRLRASKEAGLSLLPVIIRSGEETDQMKLELAIIENLHREDLSAVDRAKAFKKLIEDFKYTQAEVAKKIGKSREYVGNTVRILMLPQQILDALQEGLISEGMTRPLMMLNDRPDEQHTLFREILTKKLSVRDAEGIARRIAVEKARKQDLDPEMLTLEKQLNETLGTRVTIQKKDNGGKLVIDYFSQEDLRNIILRLQAHQNAQIHMPKDVTLPIEGTRENVALPMSRDKGTVLSPEEEKLIREDVSRAEQEAQMDMNDEELYSIKNFTI